jgi:hypothetical protein
VSEFSFLWQSDKNSSIDAKGVLGVCVCVCVCPISDFCSLKVKAKNTCISYRSYSEITLKITGRCVLYNQLNLNSARKNYKLIVELFCVQDSKGYGV